MGANWKKMSIIGEESIVKNIPGTHKILLSGRGGGRKEAISSGQMLLTAGAFAPTVNMLQ